MGNWAYQFTNCTLHSNVYQHGSVLNFTLEPFIFLLFYHPFKHQRMHCTFALDSKQTRVICWAGTTRTVPFVFYEAVGTHHKRSGGEKCLRRTVPFVFYEAVGTHSRVAASQTSDSRLFFFLLKSPRALTLTALIFFNHGTDRSVGERKISPRGYFLLVMILWRYGALITWEQEDK